MFHVKTSEFVAAAPTPLQASFSRWYIVQRKRTQQACKHTVCLPLPPPPNACIHFTRHMQHQDWTSPWCLVKAERWFARVHHGLPFLKIILRVVVLAKHFYVQGQPTNHSVHDSLRLPNLALLLSLVQGSSEENEAYSHQIQRRGQVENK